MEDLSENQKIPEYLHYREEYAREGIRVLRLARRRRLFWRIGAACVILVGAIAGWVIQVRIPAEDYHTPLVSMTSRPKAVEPIAEASSEQTSSVEINPNNKNKHQLVLMEKTFGQGGSVSSGAESPGRKSTLVQAPITPENQKVVPSAGHEYPSAIGDAMDMPSAIRLEDDVHAEIQPHRLLPIAYRRNFVEPTHSLASVVKPTLNAQWSLEASAIVSKGFGTVQDVIHPDYALRLIYGTPLNARNQLVASLGLMRISGIDRSVEVTQRTYTTGLQERKLTYSTDELYFAEFSAMYSQSITPRWRASAGPSAMVILQGVNHIEEIQSSTVDLPTAHVTKTTGYVKGFKQMGFGLLTQLEYAVSEKVSFGVDASFGITDMTKVGVFTQEKVDRNGYIGCHIRRRIF